MPHAVCRFEKARGHWRRGRPRRGAGAEHREDQVSWTGVCALGQCERVGTGTPPSLWARSINGLVPVNERAEPTLGREPPWTASRVRPKISPIGAGSGSVPATRSRGQGVGSLALAAAKLAYWAELDLSKRTVLSRQSVFRPLHICSSQPDGRRAGKASYATGGNFPSPSSFHATRAGMASSNANPQGLV